MKPSRLVIAFALVAVFISLAGATFISRSHAQSFGAAQLIVTWKATGSYVPNTYRAKTLPISGTQIVASAQVFVNRKLASLASATVYWYLDDVLLGGTVGTQSMHFSPFFGSGPTETLRVESPDYPGGILAADVTIPVAQPTVIMNKTSYDGTFSTDPVILNAVPYFFNVSTPAGLSFSWTVNGRTITDPQSPNQLQISFPAGTGAGARFDVSVSASAPNSAISASDNRTLIYKP